MTTTTTSSSTATPIMTTTSSLTATKAVDDCRPVDDSPFGSRLIDSATSSHSVDDSFQVTSDETCSKEHCIVNRTVDKN
ncbi:hypothetical protein NDU88_005758 [Pleurodeles waltl]|uniref:FHA domain-containing protein n=1 Tax=Pleurodeles waltl TaxID=8319 RepID=A0AAV7L3H7_PLEWA|nr:hypothetical protein NDU88_005758 [Pleurodeles waltl]